MWVFEVYSRVFHERTGSFEASNSVPLPKACSTFRLERIESLGNERRLFPVVCVCALGPAVRGPCPRLRILCFLPSCLEACDVFARLKIATEVYGSTIFLPLLSRPSRFRERRRSRRMKRKKMEPNIDNRLSSTICLPKLSPSVLNGSG